jgi:hypothetical protein
MFWLPSCEPGAPACGKHAVYPVEGKVLFQGKPLAGADVSFYPADESKYGESVPRPTGQTDAEGRFRLMTYTQGDGAPAGAYIVTVSGLARPSSEPGSLLDPKRFMAKTDVLNGRFVDPKTSGLKAEVKEGNNSITPFELR